MPRNVRTYDHLCMTARALEAVGDRWTLLVVRDLLSGPKRFTDLMDRLGGITPKTLTQRLRELEENGIVAADREPGRREVYYALTPAGADLAPVIEGLNRWGLRHAWRRPRAGEQLHPEHLLRSVIQSIVLAAGDQPPARWHFRIDGDDYLAENDGSHWTLTAGPPAEPADVTITTTVQGLTAYIFTGADPAGADPAGAGTALTITGNPAQVRRFRHLVRTMSTVVPSTPPTPPEPPAPHPLNHPPTPLNHRPPPRDH